ncbi:5'-methylthioadenosine/S-adenosylhomocysteine nucleosidase [uncultured Sphaerochaeta sp.]|uniref:5'-methylthioadenosine/S-adenosylhomocysteine nucleosidase family protein n=1 Tax=uncultured Sphaerochaeta sp. TaxID=886478 RepID=UPI002A0A95C0|nr:5'-methylthioadenosine/S-adenosylhomocysteine nucleosidase [uncultured Sphaerochaeta sp.]
MSVDLLVVASSEDELEGFLTKYNEVHFLDGKSYVLVPVGVGKVQASANTVRSIFDYHPKAVLCVGYAGGVDPGLSIGTCVLASSVVQYDIDLRAFHLQRGEVPSAKKGETLASLSLDCPPMEATISCIGGTADRFLLRPFREENPWLMEDLHLGFADMESYGVAYACFSMDCPCTVCRVISDDALGHRPKRFKPFKAQAHADFLRVFRFLLDRTE